MENNQKRQKLILLSIFLLVLVSYPLITIVNKPLLIAGIPLLYLYIFFVWAAVIFTIFRITAKKRKKPHE